MQVSKYMKIQAIVILYEQSEGPIVQSYDTAKSNRSHNPCLNDPCKGCGLKILITQGMWYIVPINDPETHKLEWQMK
jgi:hypothetical protein